MLSYDWLKIVGVALGLIFVWLLIFQVSATRVIPSQQFVVVNYNGNMTLGDEYSAHFSKVFDDGVLSGDVIETETVDMPMNTAYSEVFQARVELGDFDVVFVSQQGDENTLIENADENAPKEYARTYLETLLNGYRYCIYDLDLEKENNYFAQLENYLNPYYGGDYKTGELDKAKVEEDFRARAKQMKDKRYKKEEKLQEGVKIDIERIEKYQKALVAFYDYLDKGYIELVQTQHTATDSYDADWSGVYALNICPSSTTEEAKTALAKIIRYSTEDEQISAENMCVSFFDNDEEYPAYRFEGLVYAMNLVGTALNAK